MSHARLQYRVEVIRRLGVGCLSAHRLAFHKVGKDGSAKCDACYTGNSSDAVYGVVYELSAQAKHALDRIEGVGNGYDSKLAQIALRNGELVQCDFYVASHINEKLLPFEWYKLHVLRGAREANLPLDYQQRIANVPAITDTNRERNQLELSIHKSST